MAALKYYQRIIIYVTTSYTMKIDKTQLNNDISCNIVRIDIHKNQALY